jgi:putative ubiquitin-RnfH superfamily antitoxin RatB of RatAB toxin-antitoxin module
VQQPAMIWVVYCAQQQQYLRAVPWVEGLTVEQALAQSGLAEQVELPSPLALGIFGLKVSSPETQFVQVGDRIEIYRPLMLNPKEVRRKRALQHPVGRMKKGNQWHKKQRQ